MRNYWYPTLILLSFVLSACGSGTPISPPFTSIIESSSLNNNRLFIETSLSGLDNGTTEIRVILKQDDSTGDNVHLSSTESLSAGMYGTVMPLARDPSMLSREEYAVVFNENNPNVPLILTLARANGASLEVVRVNSLPAKLNVTSTYTASTMTISHDDSGFPAGTYLYFYFESLLSCTSGANSSSIGAVPNTDTGNSTTRTLLEMFTQTGLNIVNAFSNCDFTGGSSYRLSVSPIGNVTQVWVNGITSVAQRFSRNFVVKP